jgi:DNA helicase II / ATP-dependent DNA helicase PcrA
MTNKPLQLNPQQKEAATKIEGPMIVLAGPGTGKTQIIAARIATILEQTQMDPHNILCLTFTESGVAAMRKRLITMIGTAAYYVRIHTFHSFCNDVIRDFPEKFLFARDLESLTDIERVQFMQELLDELPAKSPLKPFGDPYLYRRDLEYAIQNLKRENIDPDDLASVLDEIQKFLDQHAPTIQDFISIHGNSLKTEHITEVHTQLAASPLQFVFAAYLSVGNDGGQLRDLEKKERTKLKNEIKKHFLDLQNQLPKQKTLVEIYRSYQKLLTRRGRYDYEDMILFVVKKFQEDAELLARYQEQFQYILVDEYQDTNSAQNLVVKLIGEFFPNPNIFVVGDDKQSIYRFQGASLENILYFYKLYKKDVQVVSLKENYRSHQTILDAADSLIRNNEHGIAKFIETEQSLHSAREDLTPQPVRIAELHSPSSEHYFLAKEVQALIQSGTPPSEIAIFFRDNRDAEPLADLFLRLAVPFRLEAGKDILKDNEIKKLIRLLRYISSPTEEPELFFILHYDFLGFNSGDVARLTRNAGFRRKSLFDVMSNEQLILDLGLSDPSPFTDFAKQIASWQSMSMNLPLSEFFDHIVKESGYLDFILNHPEKVEHLNRLNTLFDEIKQLNKANHNLTLKDLIEYLDLLEENNLAIKEHELKTSEDAVRLMTAHKSKGLEFDHVFIIGCTDKHWGNKPNRSKIKMPHGLLQTSQVNSSAQATIQANEDERRLFYVAMTRARKGITITYASKNANGRDQVPSIFLEEIDPQFTQKVDTTQIEEEATQRLQTIFLNIPKETADTHEQEFASSLLDNYVMSVTHLNNYLRCPRLFYYQNLLRVPSAMNKFAAFGSAVHAALNDFAVNHKKNASQAIGQEQNLLPGLSALPEKSFLIARFQHHIGRQVLTTKDHAHSLDYGKEILSAYYDNYKDEFTPYVLPEFNFSSHGVHVDGIPIKGALDIVQLLDPAAGASSPVHVIDYKTGNPDSKRKELARGGQYWRQIVFYKILCDLSPKFPNKMQSGEINFIQPSKRDGSFRKHIFQITPDEIQQVKTEIQSVYSDIKNLSFLRPDEWESCGECDYCKFFSPQ